MPVFSEPVSGELNFNPWAANEEAIYVAIRRKGVKRGSCGRRFTLCHIHKEGIKALTHFKWSNAAGL